MTQLQNFRTFVQNLDLNTKILIGFYLIGVLHWYLFFNYNSSSFNFADWAFGHQLIAVFKQAIMMEKMPYYASHFVDESLEWTRYGTRTFAMPWMTASPLVFFLKFLSVPAYITFYYTFLYSISFWGIYKWIHKLKLSLASSIFLLMLFSFNGSHVSKVAVGEGGLFLGAMLIPWFFWIINKFIEANNWSLAEKSKLMLEFSLFLFFCLSHTDLHVYYQMALVGSCVLLFYSKQLLWYLGSHLIAVFLNLWYVLPIAVFGDHSHNIPPKGHWRHSGIGGYGIQNGDSGVWFFEYDRDWPLVKRALAIIGNTIHHIWESLAYSFDASYVNVWEYNLYISPLGVLLVVVSLVGVYFKYQPFSKYLKQSRYLFGTLIIFLLSLLLFNQILVELIQKIKYQQPIDAIPSRLMVYPFSLTLLIASLGFDQMFKIFPDNIRHGVKWALLGVLFVIFMKHSFGWSLAESQLLAEKGPEKIFHVRIYNEIDPRIYSEAEDKLYREVVAYSYLASFIFLCCAGIVYWKISSHIKNKALYELAS